MDGFSTSVISAALGWIRDLVRMIREGISHPGSSEGLLGWIGEHWTAAVVILCLAGTLTDLIVYLFRWRPFLVWKSWFRRRKARKNTALQEEPAAYGEAGTHPQVQNEPEHNSFRFVPEEQDSTEAFEEDELERWREPAAENRNATAPTEITRAGYSVPADSAYRRPAGDRNPEEYVSNTQRSLDRMLAPRRRRKRSPAGLFGDADENGYLYEPPQPVIDSREAYHAPVYPRNWKESENDEP